MDSLSAPSAASHTAAPAITPLLRTVLLCDLVDSTALVERLGDSRVAQLWQRHDQLLQRLLARSQGQLIDKADGVLALFERPVQALEFALTYQRELQALGRDFDEHLRARIGIHVGDVMTWTHTPEEVLAGAKPVEVEGLAKPVAARLMALALPGQILLSGMAQNLAQRAQSELGEQAKSLRWQLHGRYRFKGVPTPMLVHEAGIVGLSPLKPPPSGDKAWRELPVWRKPPVLALEMMVLLGLLVGGVWSTLRSPPAIAFSERDWVVVADFNNLTGETLYDDALDSALRIGLEQSRYVNVLSDLQVDQALQRMQREDQRLDRQSGSELALREGAKALVLPTVADVGGRPRVTVEVVDPASGVTVYTHMADASGSGGVVAALDDVLVEMRADLGESMASIQKGSVPLEQATTDSLEALRAFSLGQEARVSGKPLEALAFFAQATQLDPEFSMAYLRMALINLANDTQAAERYFDLAGSKRDRLSHREELLLDASLAMFESPSAQMKQWQAMAAMYPDEYRAYYNYSYFAHFDAQQHLVAAEFIAPALSPMSPFRVNAYQIQGLAYLAADRLDSAVDAFKQAESLGARGFVYDYAAAMAARRDYADAERILAGVTRSGLGHLVVQEALTGVSIMLDQGRWSEARQAIAGLIVEVGEDPGLPRWGAQLLDFSLRQYEPDEALPSELRSFLDGQRLVLESADPVAARSLTFNVLTTGWMLARLGDGPSARKALAAAEPRATKFAQPASTDMALLLRAELDLMEKRPKQAIARLAPRAAKGDELYFVHSSLMRAYAQQGDLTQALAQAEWLYKSRGRAYGEFNRGRVWQLANLAESNLAVLAASRFAGKLGHLEKAAKLREDFERNWPGGDSIPAVARRANELD